MDEQITVVEVEGIALYHKYPGQSSPQPAQVVLDCRSRTLSARANPEIGGARTLAEFHGHVRTWTIPALKANAANELLHDLAPLAEAACDGYVPRWEGSNEVASFTDEAQDALNEIAARCDEDADEDDEVVVLTAEQWLGGIGHLGHQAATLGITVASTDSDLERIAAECRTEAAQNGIDEVQGLVPHLQMVQQHLAEKEQRP